MNHLRPFDHINEEFLGIDLDKIKQEAKKFIGTKTCRDAM